MSSRSPKHQERSKKPTPEPKIRTSCDACAEAKVRCSKGHPRCERCIASGHKCVYGISLKHGKQLKRRTATAASSISSPSASPRDAKPKVGSPLKNQEHVFSSSSQASPLGIHDYSTGMQQSFETTLPEINCDFSFEDGLDQAWETWEQNLCHSVSQHNLSSSSASASTSASSAHSVYDESIASTSSSATTDSLLPFGGASPTTSHSSSGGGPYSAYNSSVMNTPALSYSSLSLSDVWPPTDPSQQQAATTAAVPPPPPSPLSLQHPNINTNTNSLSPAGVNMNANAAMNMSVGMNMNLEANSIPQPSLSAFIAAQSIPQSTCHLVQRGDQDCHNTATALLDRLSGNTTPPATYPNGARGWGAMHPYHQDHHYQAAHGHGHVQSVEDTLAMIQHATGVLAKMLACPCAEEGRMARLNASILMQLMVLCRSAAPSSHNNNTLTTSVGGNTFTPSLTTEWLNLSSRISSSSQSQSPSPNQTPHALSPLHPPSSSPFVPLPHPSPSPTAGERGPIGGWAATTTTIATANDHPTTTTNNTLADQVSLQRVLLLNTLRQIARLIKDMEGKGNARNGGGGGGGIDDLHVLLGSWLRGELGRAVRVVEGR